MTKNHEPVASPQATRPECPRCAANDVCITHSHIPKRETLVADQKQAEEDLRRVLQSPYPTPQCLTPPELEDGVFPDRVTQHVKHCEFCQALLRGAAQPAAGATPCEICGEPLPAGEEMFKYHGYSGNCPNNGACDDE